MPVFNAHVFKKPLIESKIDRTDGTAIGNLVNFAGLAAAFDGVTSQTSTNSAGKATIPEWPGYVGKYWGSGVTKKLSKVIVYGSSDVGFGALGATITLTIQGSTDNFSSSVVDLGSGTITDIANVTKEVAATDTSTSYEYHRVKLEGGTVGVKNCICSELEMWELL